MSRLKQAKRKAAFLKIGVSAVSGGGKTYGSLLLAKGLVEDWSKIAIIDTENGSGNLYENLGNYNVLELDKFSPNDYIKAIDECVEAGMKCIIIDSISAEWAWCLNYHAKLGGTFQNWKDVNPHHDNFKNKILQAPAHIITSVRRKQKYEIAKGSDGKNVVNKLGAEEINREGWEYELTVNFEIDENHLARASKDRTQLFSGREDFIITEQTGIELRNWAISPSNDEDLLQKALIEVNNSDSLEVLKEIYESYTELHGNDSFKNSVKTKKTTFNK